ncbi:MAG: prenyltransferase/squalene oxidase repeat-containing protein [Bacteroidota bacterium]
MKYLPLLLLILLSSCKPLNDTADYNLFKAVEYLWSQQAPDGGWHSETHGILKGGQAYTAFVLYQLLQVPNDFYPVQSAKIDQAVAFIKTHTNEAGALGLADPQVLEYPNYATSYALRALYQLDREPDLQRKMAGYLLSQQFTEARGIGPEHPAYGAWGFGEMGIPTGETGHVDLSHTRKVLQALQETEIDAPEAFEKAQGFLRLLQKQSNDSRVAESVPFDGGFYFSSVVADANKAGPLPEGPHFHSYGTATCEGILASVAAGVASDDSSRLQPALDWLTAHDTLPYDQAIPAGSNWRNVLVYYHFWVRAEVYDQFGGPNGWQQEMRDSLAIWQEYNGRFRNLNGAANKEDDPLVATSMMVDVLLRTRSGQ